MNASMQSLLNASLEAALERARALVVTDSAAGALLERAAADVRARPYLFIDLSEGEARTKAKSSLAPLEGLLTLRLWLLHHALHPWLVSPAEAEAARQLIPALRAEEAALLGRCRDEGLSPRAELLYATLLALHPVPPHAGGAPERGLGSDLASLVHRWEEAHRRPRAFGSVVAEKARQHALFYRAFAFAPAYLRRRQRIRALLPAIVAGHPVMRETFSAIEQLGPVLDNFVFAGRGRALRPRVIAIADLAFLYMQLADEVVDSILHAAGPAATLSLVEKLYARESRERDLVPLANLDAAALESIGLYASLAVPKYATTLGGLLEALEALRRVMETCIDALEASRREALRGSVRGFFHHCFATFLDELHLPRVCHQADLDRLPLAETQWHTYRKNNLVMMRWVALRMELLGLDPADRLPELRAWGYILASFQVFDDMKDVWVDLGKQPSYPLQIAATAFPDEYAALERAFPGERRGIDQDEAPWLALRVPKTVLTCIRLARLMALSHFDWFTFYVADYRWRRNWLLRARSFNLPPVTPHGPLERPLRPAEPMQTGVPVLDAVFAVLADTQPLRGHLRGDPDGTDEYLAYVLDVVGYDHLGEVLRAALPDLRLAYRFLNLRMRMTSREKATLLRRLVRRHHRAAAEALPRYRERTGSFADAHFLSRSMGLPLRAPLLLAGSR
jgi:hypothetical protein